MPITKNRDSSPLICKIEFAFTDDILSMEAVELHKVDIAMKPDKAFAQIYGTPSQYTFSEPADASPSGLLHKQRLSIYYPGLNVSVQPELIALERKPVVVKIYYQNDEVQVIGSIENPAKVFMNFNSSDATGNGLTIACDSDERARFLQAD